jgi:HEAT repeat protein
MERFSDPHPAVRFWALARFADVTKDTEVAHRDRIREMLGDPSPSVRIEAAGLLARLSAEKELLDLLVEQVDSRNEWAAVHAARTLELLGEKCRPYRDELADLLRARASGFFVDRGPRAADYSLEFSLISLLKRLDERS